MFPPYFVETHQKSGTLGIKSSKEQEMSTFKMLLVFKEHSVKTVTEHKGTETSVTTHDKKYDL